MKEEKMPSGEIVLEGRFAKWFDNFWYHYKWVTIGIAALVIVLVICIAQACTREKKDIMIVYAGHRSISVAEQQQLNELFSTLLPEDLDQNGESVAHLSMYQIFSEEQIKEIESKKDENGKPLRVDREHNTSQYSTYSSYLQTGESSIYLLDPWLYEELLRSGGVRPLSEVFSEIPKGAIDEYGIRLGDTELYENYDVLKFLPEDTVLCLMQPLVMGKSSKEKNYNFEVETFRAISNYRKED